MGPKEITSVAIKFFGIYLMVNVVLYFPSMIMSLAALERYQEENFSSIVFVTVVGAFILLGLVVSFVLFHLANSIASKAAEPDQTTSSLSQVFLLQVLGIYFIVSGLSVLPGYGISIFIATEANITELFYGAGHLFQIAVGCYLLIKPVVWARWLSILRGQS